MAEPRGVKLIQFLFIFIFPNRLFYKCHLRVCVLFYLEWNNIAHSKWSANNFGTITGNFHLISLEKNAALFWNVHLYQGMRVVLSNNHCHLGWYHVAVILSASVRKFGSEESRSLPVDKAMQGFLSWFQKGQSIMKLAFRWLSYSNACFAVIFCSNALTDWLPERLNLLRSITHLCRLMQHR